jgi:hypothetical protein
MRKMLQNSWKLGFLLVAVSHCGKKAPAKVVVDPESGPVTLQFFAATGGLPAVYQAIATSDEFKAAFPTVTVNVVSSDDLKAGGTAPTFLENCADSATGCPDIAAVATNDVLIVSDAVLDLSQAPYSVTLDAYADVSIPSHRGPSGQVWGLPMDLGGPVMNFYRPDLIAAAMTQYNTTASPATPLDTSAAGVQAYMDNLTWDDFITQLAPYLLSPAGGAGNAGFATNPISSVYEIAEQFDFSGLLDVNLNYNPAYDAYIRKYVDIVRQLVRGGNSASMTSGYVAAQSYVAAYQVPAYQNLDASQWPCHEDVTGGTGLTDAYPANGILDIWSTYWGCQTNQGIEAVHPMATWGQSFFSGGFNWLIPGLPPRDNFTWMAGQYQMAKPFGLKKGSLLTIDVANLSALWDGAGTSVVVAKSTKFPKTSTKVAAWFSSQSYPQITTFTQLGSFPASKAALSDPTFNAPNTNLGGQVVGPLEAAVVQSAAQLGDVPRTISAYDTANRATVFALTYSVINLSADLSDANATALQDEFLSQLQAQIALNKAQPPVAE